MCLGFDDIDLKFIEARELEGRCIIIEYSILISNSRRVREIKYRGVTKNFFKTSLAT